MAPSGNGFDVATQQEQQCEIQCERHSNCLSWGNTPSSSACSSFCYRKEGGGSSADRTKTTKGKGNLEILGSRGETGGLPPDSEHNHLLWRQSVNNNLLYRVSLKSFPDYKHLLQETVRCTSVRRVSAVDNFPKRWWTSTLGFRCSSVFGCNISKQVDLERWSDTLATTIAGYHPSWLLFMRVC